MEGREAPGAGVSPAPGISPKSWCRQCLGGCQLPGPAPEAALGVPPGSASRPAAGLVPLLLNFTEKLHRGVCCQPLQEDHQLGVADGAGRLSVGRGLSTVSPEEPLGEGARGPCRAPSRGRAGVSPLARSRIWAGAAPQAPRSPSSAHQPAAPAPAAPRHEATSTLLPLRPLLCPGTGHRGGYWRPGPRGLLTHSRLLCAHRA